MTHCARIDNMKTLQFHYHMEIAFSEPVHSHIFTLKCLPQTGGTQRIKTCVYRISPGGRVQEGTDSFGNRMLYGTAEEEHSLFLVDVTGTAVTDVQDPDMPQNTPDVSIYRYRTPLTQPGRRIGELLEHCRKRTAGMSLYDKALVYMEAVHGSIQYGRGVTDINTAAEDALALGRGVCQDYSHILLALCREDRIPSRYVVGMLTGDGESHAWVEMYDGARWYGFDPTNNLPVEDSHIKISHGRDYRDCSINRGVFTGQAAQRQSILVEVTENGGTSV